MKITDILSEDLVLPALAGRSKDDVIEELARAVAERHRDEVDFAKLVQALEDREKLNSTALGEGVAIPHGKLPGLRRVIAAFGRSPLGVDFSSLDGKPTHLRSEEHTSELQSHSDLVCRLLLEKKKQY